MTVSTGNLPAGLALVDKLARGQLVAAKELAGGTPALPGTA
jgi:hypothetical protein